MVLSDGTTSSLSDLFKEHNPDKKVECVMKDYFVNLFSVWPSTDKYFVGNLKSPNMLSITLTTLLTGSRVHFCCGPPC